MKTLVVVTALQGRPPSNELARLEATDQYPRVSLFGKTLQSDLLDERFLERVPFIRRLAYRIFPVWLAQVCEAFLIRKRYDVVISYADHLALLYALFLKLARSRHPHVAILFWISKPKKALLLKRVHSFIDRMIMWTSVHRTFAIEELGISPSKIAFIRHPVDQLFFRPMDVKTDMICSAGFEMRDYNTLLEALQGLDIRCHIATGMYRGELNKYVKAIRKPDTVPDQINVGLLPYPELRGLYARSRFVIVPLFPSDSDNGLTTILESMAMGKAVICSRTRGQIDVIQEGITGILVSPCNAAELREAIIYLWNNEKIAREMGMAGRRYVEEHHTLDQFVGNVKSIVESLLRKGSEPPVVKKKYRYTRARKHSSVDVPSNLR